MENGYSGYVMKQAKCCFLFYTHTAIHLLVQKGISLWQFNHYKQLSKQQLMQPSGMA